MASLEQAVIAAQNDRDQVGALLAPFAQDTSLRTTSHTSPVLWAGLLALLRPRQPHVDDDLAAVLRVLRVLVAGNTDHAVLLTSSGVAAQLQRLAVWLLNRLDEDGDKDKDESATAASLLLLVLVLQVVHNASASSVPTAGLFLWGLLARDTTTLQQLLLLRHSKPQGIALQWLHLVLANEPSARSQLCRTGAGLDNLAALLRAAEHLHDQDSSSSHFDRVVDTVWLLASGASDGVVGRSLHGLLANGQLAELHTLLKVLEGKTHGELARDQPTELSHEVAEHAADVLRRLIVGAEGEPSFSPGVAALAQAANEVRTDCVIVLLMILGNVAATSGSTKRTAIVDAIMRANILQTVVELLREARKIAPRSARASDSQAASSTPSVSSALFGLKREAIRFLANITSRQRAVQDKLRELEGVSVLLDHCNIDDHNPFIREWALFALHNACEGNVENQAIIAGLEKLKPADNAELKDLGLQIRVAEDGRMLMEQDQASGGSASSGPTFETIEASK